MFYSYIRAFPLFVIVLIANSCGNLLKLDENKIETSSSLNKSNIENHSSSSRVPELSTSLPSDNEKIYQCGNDEFLGLTGKRKKKNLTYFIESYGTSLEKENVNSGIKEAFTHWDVVVDLTFTEVNDTKADIVFGFKSFTRGDNFSLDIGSTNSFQTAICIPNYWKDDLISVVYFNDDLKWTYFGWDKYQYRMAPLHRDQIDFLIVAMHQIGHAIGLEHIDNDDGTFNIMNRRYTRPANKNYDDLWPRIQEGDIKAINDLYRKVEDFEAIKANCRNYWDNHETAAYNNQTDEYILVVKGFDNFAAALNYCRKIGGSLASIHSEQENKFITDLIRSQLTLGQQSFIGDSYILALGRQSYIGLTRKDVNSMWIWEDGISLDQSNYKNWAEGEPNSQASNENVAELIAQEGTWNDVPNYVIRLAVCEVGCPPLVVEEAYQTEEKSSETLTKEDDQIALNNIAKNYTSFKYLFIMLVILIIF